MEKIRVAMCDDLKEFCIYYESIISKQPDMEFIGMVHNTPSCKNLVKTQKPDILLLDIQMETIDAGIKLLPIIAEESPETKTITLTIHEDDDYIFDALALGAVDFLLKTFPDEQIIKVIRDVYHNTNPLRPELSQKLFKACNLVKKQQASLLYIVNTFTKLSNTEYDILHDICNDYSYKEIAEKRFVEEITVRAHVSRILKKFGFNNMKKLVKELKSMKVFDLLK